MGASTGPILAATGITFGNQWILNHKSPDFRILLGGAIATGFLSLFEHASPTLASGIAWIALITCLLTNPVGGGNSPVQNLLATSGLGGKLWATLKRSPR
jgi:hypothetical protein